MRLEFLGTGTSYGVPQIGCSCEVCLSTDPRDKRLRSSIWVHDHDFSIIVDTGPDFRFQCLRSGITRLDAVLFTHFHADHVFGIDDIRQFNTLLKKEIPIFVPNFMTENFHQCFGYTLATAKPGLNRPRLALHIVSNIPIEINDLTIVPVDIWHGVEKIKGYIFQKNQRKISYLIDCKTLPENTIEMVRDSDVVILNALWQDKYSHPAHLNLDEALELSCQLNGKKTFFTHITHKMGLHSLTSETLPGHAKLAYDNLELIV